jgi:hypothetical protein
MSAVRKQVMRTVSMDFRPNARLVSTQVWYLSGFCQGRAWRSEWCIKNLPLLLSLERRA